jgi:hypothetical protein
VVCAVVASSVVTLIPHQYLDPHQQQNCQCQHLLRSSRGNSHLRNYHQHWPENLNGRRNVLDAGSVGCEFDFGLAYNDISLFTPVPVRVEGRGPAKVRDATVWAFPGLLTFLLP